MNFTEFTRENPHAGKMLQTVRMAMERRGNWSPDFRPLLQAYVETALLLEQISRLQSSGGRERQTARSQGKMAKDLLETLKKLSDQLLLEDFPGIPVWMLADIQVRLKK